MTAQKDLGLQPLDAIMTGRRLSNSDLVSVSTRQLTHKMVQKGRKGRRLTPHIQMKILQALNAAIVDRKFKIEELFNY